MMRFKAEGRQIFKEPEKTENGFRLGFALCEVNANIVGPENIAQAIAKLLNEHWSQDADG